MSSVYPTTEPASVLSTKERLWYFVATNRKHIGAWMSGAAVLVRGAAFIKSSGAIADWLALIGNLLILGGGMTLAAGTTHNDQHFKEKKQAVIRGRSGQFRAVMHPYGRS